MWQSDVCFDFDFAAKGGETVGGESFHLVFAGEDVPGRQPAAALYEPRRDVFGIGHAAGEQYCVDFAVEHCALGRDSFGYVVNHGIEDELGVFVAALDALDDFAHVVGA